MTIPAKRRRTQGPRPARPLLIVGRKHVALYESLNWAFGGLGGIPVLLDRRRGERRRGVQPVLGERRHTDRRSRPSIAHDLRFQQYVLVRPHSRRRMTDGSPSPAV